MDDGSKLDRGQIVLNTYCFTEKEVLLLQDSLKVKFNLRSRIQKTRNQ